MTSSISSQGQTSKIIPAFLKAKSLFEPVVRNRSNPSYRSTYADLSAIEDAITPGLAKCGLLYQQVFKIEPGHRSGQFTLNVKVVLRHRSGQSLSDVFTVPYKGGEIDLHSMGSFITYFRRYSLLSFLGLATYDESDDDGNRGKQDGNQGRCGDEGLTAPTDVKSDDDEGLTAPTDVKSDDDEGLTTPTNVKSDDDKGLTAPTDVKSDDDEGLTAPTDVKSDDDEGLTAPTDVKSDDDEGLTTPTNVKSDDDKGLTAPTDVKSDDDEGLTTPTDVKSDDDEGQTAPIDVKSDDKSDGDEGLAASTDVKSDDECLTAPTDVKSDDKSDGDEGLAASIDVKSDDDEGLAASIDVVKSDDKSDGDEGLAASTDVKSDDECLTAPTDVKSDDKSDGDEGQTAPIDVKSDDKSDGDEGLAASIDVKSDDDEGQTAPIDVKSDDKSDGDEGLAASDDKSDDDEGLTAPTDDKSDDDEGLTAPIDVKSDDDEGQTAPIDVKSDDKSDDDEGLTAPIDVKSDGDEGLAASDDDEGQTAPIDVKSDDKSDDDEDQTASPSKIAVLSSLFGQLPSERRDQFIRWCLKKGYYSEGTNSFNFDLIKPETLERVIESCSKVIAENHELDALKQDIFVFLETHRDIDIPVLGREIGVESAKSLHDFSLEQLRELKKLCHRKLATAWEALKAKAEVDEESTISQSQKEEIQQLWSESCFGTNVLFDYLSVVYKLKIEKWDHIPSKYFDEICDDLPDISEKIARHSGSNGESQSVPENQVQANVLGSQPSGKDVDKDEVESQTADDGEVEAYGELRSQISRYMQIEGIPEVFIGFFETGKRVENLSELSDAQIAHLWEKWERVISLWENVRSISYNQEAVLRDLMKAVNISEYDFMLEMESEYGRPEYLRFNGVKYRLSDLPESLFDNAISFLKSLSEVENVSVMGGTIWH